MKVVAPSNTMDAYGLLRSAIDDPDPVLFIENMPCYWTKGEAPPSGHRVPIGKAAVVAEGSDVTVVSYSRVLLECLGALKPLAEAGISAEVIDLRSIQPWDQETVCASVAKTGRLLVVHEAVTPFGVGAEIAAVVTERLFGQLKAPVARLGAPFAPVPFTKPLEEAFTPNAERIARWAIDLVKGLPR
jgi:pyruvate dehydrogenase E1 component beta subunit